MKKLIAFAAVVTMVLFASCGNKTAQTDNAPAEEAVQVEEVAPEMIEEEIILEEAAPADSAAVVSAQ